MPETRMLAMATALCAFAAAAPAQEPPAPPEPPSPAKLADWPELKKTEKDEVRAQAKQFRKQQHELHADAHRRLVEIGAGGAPILFRLVTDRDDNVNERLFAVLDEIVTDRHAALLAREAQQPSVALRRYVVRRLCGFDDAELVPAFETAAKDKDEDVVIYAALGLLTQKKKDGLERVLQAARQRWQEFGPLIAEVLPRARCAQCGDWVFAAIAQAPAADQMAGLRVARYLMVKQQGVILRSYLQAADHTVKREAINTARVLHGEQPIENLSVFQAIEMAKQWLDKL